MEERRKRSLTEDDVEALACALEKRIVGRFYINVGKGLVAYIWKAVLWILVLLAAYGAGVKGMKF